MRNDHQAPGLPCVTCAFPTKSAYCSRKYNDADPKCTKSAIPTVQAARCEEQKGGAMVHSQLVSVDVHRLFSRHARVAFNL